MDISVLGNQEAVGTRIALMGSEGTGMLACNRLLIDPSDGSSAVDYRIEDGWVESRTVEKAESGTLTEKRWQRLTPAELSSHVIADTVVARWLRRRMGVHRLIRACTSNADNSAHEHSERVAA
jgi:hypothetical protein